MKLDQFVLAQNLAFLIAVPPDSNLAKLLRFCLTIKMRENLSGAKLLQLIYELMQNPANLPYWTQDIMGHNFDYTAKEWQALGELEIKDAEEFMKALSQELENLDLG